MCMKYNCENILRLQMDTVLVGCVTASLFNVIYVQAHSQWCYTTQTVTARTTGLVM